MRPSLPMLALFRIGFLVLFLELAVIRWLAAFVPFLAYFTNVVLVAAFLGMSAGCLLPAGSGWLRRAGWAWLGLVAGTLGLHRVYRQWAEVNLDLGGGEVVFYGAEARLDLARFHVPIELVALLCFLGTAAAFLGLGQAMARAFERVPDRVAGYSANVAGSLAGVGAFALLSYLELPPAAWFGVGFVLLLMVQRGEGELRRTSAMVVALAWLAIALTGSSHGAGYTTSWSPYYRIVHEAPSGSVSVNGIGHQRMWPLDARGVGGIYRLVHELRRAADGAPFRRVLVIGAGTGNDVAHALVNGAEIVDAVDIDPALLRLGREHHPERPYADPRVRCHVADGRRFLATAEPGYDLVVYGLVDSLILSSSVGDLRLESFLFTREALDEVRRVLAPDGVLVTMNFFREEWVAQRVARTLAEVFGAPPRRAELSAAGTALFAGDVEGFALPESSLALAPEPARDDWPFPYLRAPGVPGLYVRTAFLLLAAGWLVLRLAHGARPKLGGRMFFLGAGFLLLETRAVVALGLGYGNTWVTSSIVLAGVLALILAANWYPARSTTASCRGPYLALLASLAVAWAAPTGAGSRELAAFCALAPIAFAAVIFARTFRTSRAPAHDLGANIAGALLGGLCEYLSLALGFRALLLVAALFYPASWPRRR